MSTRLPKHKDPFTFTQNIMQNRRLVGVGRKPCRSWTIIGLQILLLVFVLWQFGLLLHETGSIGASSYANYDVPNNNNSPTLTSHSTIGSEIGRRVIYQCTCADNSFWANKYWNVDLGRGKQWRRALRRISSLIPEIETKEFIQDETSTSTCEELILNDMKQSGPPDVYEVIYSLRYNCTQSKLNSLLSKSDISEYVEIIPWKRGGRDDNAAHIVRKRGMVRIIYDWGETFQGRYEHCNTMKSHNYAREWIAEAVSNPNDVTAIELSHSKRLMPHQQMCNLIHVPEHIDWATIIADYRNVSVNDMLTKRMTKEEARVELRQKEAFAGLITFSTWKDVYEIDALVRHALCDLLTEQYKPCDHLVSWKGDVDRLEAKLNITTRVKTNGGAGTQFRYDTAPLYSRYKFVLALNNALYEGYMTEKEINPYLAQSVAIVGAPDYHKMANVDRVVHCDIPQNVLVDAGRWVRGNSFMPFNTTPDDWKRDPTIQPIPFDLKHDEDLLEFAKDKFAKVLQPCIEEIKRLDQDDDAYVQKLMEPFILKYENSLFDGTYVAKGILQWLLAMSSPLMIGLESSLQRIHIDDQSGHNL